MYLYALIELIDDQEQVAGERSFAAIQPAAGIRKLRNKNLALRPLVAEAPALEWWQQIAGHSYEIAADQVTKRFAIADRPLSEVKRQRKNAVDDLLLEKGATGVPVDGKRIQLRPQDQPNVTAMALRAMLAKSGAIQWDSDFAWRMADNSFFPVATADEMLALAESAAVAVIAVRKIAWAHKDAIERLTTAAEVAAYDIAQGW